MFCYIWDVFKNFKTPQFLPNVILGCRYLGECNFFVRLQFTFKRELTFQFKHEIKFFLIHFGETLLYKIGSRFLQFTWENAW